MKHTCWRVFSYLFIDREAAQTFLNGMAREGWELDLIWTKPLVRFRRTERTDLRYFLDWGDPRHGEDPEYLALCEEAGWELRERLGYWNLYVSRPGTCPAPIQTDSEVEYERFRGKALRRMAFGGGITAGVVVLCVLPLLSAHLVYHGDLDLGAFLFQSLSTSVSMPVLYLLLPFWLAGGLGYLILLGRRLLAWRRALEAGAELPAPRALEVWRRLSALVALLSLPLCLVLLLDIALNGYSSWGVPVGGAIGGYLLLNRGLVEEDRWIRRSAYISLGVAVLLALAMVLHGPIRKAVPGRLPPAPLVPTHLVDDGRYSEEKRFDGLLGSEASWWERGVDEEGRPDPLVLYQVEARTWITPALAQKALERERERLQLVPLEGREGVWQGEGGLLYFRDRTLVWVSEWEDGPQIDDGIIWSWMGQIP